MPGSQQLIKLDDDQPLRESVFEAMREAIMSGHVSPGERLMEVQVAEALAIGDAERARQIAAEHIESAENILMFLVKNEESRGREPKRD